MSTDNDLMLAHTTMKKEFEYLSSTIQSDNAEEGTADKMIQVLNTYSNLFHCSKGSAYSRIKFNMVNHSYVH